MHLGFEEKLSAATKTQRQPSFVFWWAFSNKGSNPMKGGFIVDRQYFRRGDICKKIAPSTMKRTPKYYLVMKVVDSEHLLVAAIYDQCEAYAIDCRMNTGCYRIRYAAIYNEESQNFEREKSAWLYSARECVNEVYENHREYRRQKHYKAKMKRIEAIRLANEMKELRRLKAFDLQVHESVPVPASVSWYARHPLQGGSVNPR